MLLVRSWCSTPTPRGPTTSGISMVGLICVIEVILKKSILV